MSTASLAMASGSAWTTNPHVLRKDHLGAIGQIGAVELQIDRAANVLSRKDLRQPHVEDDGARRGCRFDFVRRHTVAASDCGAARPRFADLIRA